MTLLFVFVVSQVRVSKEQDHVLISPRGLSFAEVTAANLVRNMCGVQSVNTLSVTVRPFLLPHGVIGKAPLSDNTLLAATPALNTDCVYNYMTCVILVYVIIIVTFFLFCPGLSLLAKPS